MRVRAHLSENHLQNYIREHVRTDMWREKTKNIFDENVQTVDAAAP